MAASSAAPTALQPLKAAQAAASDPDAHVWLSASAGTGKTHVLAARVYRLLLRGVEPGCIQCLTFTKAGAAEMAGRINRRLAAWVRMPSTELAHDLLALGERNTQENIATARTLFAKVLDAPGGGLRIQTIHSFCQGLLAAFPVEAGLTPGFRLLEGREEVMLQREALAQLLVDADREGRARPVEAIGALSRRLGEDGAEQFLHTCATAPVALDALPAGIGPWLRRQLDLPQGDIAAYVAEQCADFDCDALAEIVALNRAWGKDRGLARAVAIEEWVALDPAGRAAGLEAFGRQWSTAKGWAPQDEGYAEQATALRDDCALLAGLIQRGAYADLLAAGLEVGRDYARAFQAAKRRVGAVDFDDLIETVVRLLRQPGIGEWVRFKLDQQTAHVLIDEAQDTNAQQWAIVRALAQEFFQGRGIFAPQTRTLFTVGDYKQAIFSFQGTDPTYFAAAEDLFTRLARNARGEDGWPEHERGLPLERLSLTSSFRSTAPVLAFVDAAVAAIPAPGLGPFAPPEAHHSEVPGPGTVTLWPPVRVEDDADESEESWIDTATRKLARQIARAVKDWLADPACVKRDGSRLLPGDVMILVKRRGDLASLLVARLYAEGVPVAGVDRLRLNAPLAVQDLLAAIRFVLQPEDDLSLAALLVSPLLGWTQDELMAAAAPREGGLWRHLRATQPAERLAPLSAMLARADIATPYQLLEELLSGPLDGRRKLLSRLGEEARDYVEELLNAALQFESATTPSLQRFLDWFDRGEVDVKRDLEAPQDAVRVITAHAAKGLQAPFVILADACVDPTQNRSRILKWAYDEIGPPLPVFRPRAAERAGPMDAAIQQIEAREMQEHWRLFYVAATHTKEQLVVARSLSASVKQPPETSWYATAARAMTALGVPEEDGERVFARGDPVSTPRRQEEAKASTAVALPGWARTTAPQEQRPPRPLAPSALGEDAVADPPPSAATRAAAERGRLLHALFQRLPAVAPDRRREAAERWLRDSGGVSDAAARDEIAGGVCAIIADRRFAALFGPDSLAEAPVTAVLGDGLVVAGTVDRLLVTPERVRIVDFKTGRRAPVAPAEIPEYHLRQMAAYAAALRVIFPGRPVEAALLYTGGPALFDLPPDLLDRHKPRLPGAEQS